IRPDAFTGRESRDSRGRARAGTGLPVREPRSGRHGHGLLDRESHHRAPLGPRAVVVPDPLVAEQLVEDEPRVARALADPAVGDDVLVGRHALRLVEALELVTALERAVLADRPGPGGRRGAGEVSGPQRGLPQAGRGGRLAG